MKLLGRGGQGIVTAGELLAKSATLDAMHAQSIPSFGAERRGGPSQSTLRISNHPILLRCNPSMFDVICIFDPTIWHFVDATRGLKEDSVLIFNSRKKPSELEKSLRSGKYPSKLTTTSYRIHSLDATGIAVDLIGRPITNTTMMGAFSAATDLVSMEKVIQTINAGFGPRSDANIKAAEKAFSLIQEQVGQYKHNNGRAVDE
jgi:2-oxoacid:acceptor oxidoreductase gamma subunit (pyruvate/2-ketoisovalerate family)